MYEMQNNLFVLFSVTTTWCLRSEVDCLTKNSNKKVPHNNSNSVPYKISTSTWIVSWCANSFSDVVVYSKYWFAEAKWYFCNIM